ncbi:uncharacterized protein LOC139918669 [Centroberyx gerrardi]
MRVNVFGCLLAFALVCAGSNTNAEINHEIVDEKGPVTLLCPRSVEDTVTWSRESNGSKVDILTVDGDGEKRHIHDPFKRYKSVADKSLYILKTNVSDTGKYFCNDEPAVELTVIPPGTTRLTVKEKTNVTLKCPHAGLDGLTWSRIINGGEQDIYVIKNGTGKHLQGQGRRFGSTKDKSLTVTKVKPADSGLYYCDGKPAAHLTVIKAPTPPTETTTAMTTIRTTTTLIAPVSLATSPSTPTPPTIILPSTPLATTRKTAKKNKTSTRKPQNKRDEKTTTLGYWQLPVGMVSGILLFIIIFITWRCWSKRRAGSDEQRVEPIYTEIPDGSVVQPTCGVERPTGSSAIYYLADFPANSKTPAVWLDGLNQSDDTYCIIPDPAPVQPGDKTETSVPNDSTYSLITGPNLQGNNEETPLGERRENFYSN